MQRITLEHPNQTNLLVHYAGTTYAIPPATNAIKSMCRQLKDAAGAIMFGRPTKAMLALVAKENNEDLVPRLIGDAYQDMLKDDRTEEERKALGTVVMHFHGHGITGARRVAAQYNRQAGK